MKNYKMVNSKAVQEKAQRLGYDWRKKEDETHCRIDTVIDPFLCTFASYESIATCNFNDWNTAEYHQEITQADFLALPEPFKVGDHIMYKSSKHTTTIVHLQEHDMLREYETAIVHLQEHDMLREYETAIVHLQEHDMLREYETATKLTPQQVEILELDDDIIIKGENS